MLSPWNSVLSLLLLKEGVGYKGNSDRAAAVLVHSVGSVPLVCIYDYYDCFVSTYPEFDVRVSLESLHGCSRPEQKKYKNQCPLCVCVGGVRDKGYNL